MTKQSTTNDEMLAGRMSHNLDIDEDDVDERRRFQTVKDSSDHRPEAAATSVAAEGADVMDDGTRTAT